MMYTRINASFYTNPKIQGPSLQAIGAFTLLLSYCAGGHSNGEIPDGIAQVVSRGEMDELIEAGLVERRERDWYIPSYLDAGNPTVARTKHRREKNAEHQQAHRDREKAKSNGHKPKAAEKAVEDAVDDAPVF
jgi:hypothetical protein